MTENTMEGKQYRGKPKRQWMDDINQWTGDDYLHLR